MSSHLFSSPRPIEVASRADQFGLYLILAVSASGVPTVAGIDPSQVMTGNPFSQDAVGCLAIGMELAAGPVLLIGHVPFDAICRAFSQGAAQTANTAPEKPLSLKCGRSELRLYPDGRIRILGDDVSIEALGRMAMKGAVVELN
ncbi:hypothetical protein [Agrobacterium sp. CG674]